MLVDRSLPTGGAGMRVSSQERAHARPANAQHRLCAWTLFCCYQRSSSGAVVVASASSGPPPALAAPTTLLSHSPPPPAYTTSTVSEATVLHSEAREKMPSLCTSAQRTFFRSIRPCEPSRSNEEIWVREDSVSFISPRALDVIACEKTRDCIGSNGASPAWCEHMGHP